MTRIPPRFSRFFNYAPFNTFSELWIKSNPISPDFVAIGTLRASPTIRSRGGTALPSSLHA